MRRITQRKALLLLLLLVVLGVGALVVQLLVAPMVLWAPRTTPRLGAAERWELCDSAASWLSVELLPGVRLLVFAAQVDRRPSGAIVAEFVVWVADGYVA